VRTRPIQVPGSTGMETIQQDIVVYDIETHDVGGVVYAIEAIHVSGNPDNLGEFTVSREGEELERLFVDFDSTGTVSEATEDGEKTTYTPSHALEVLRAIPYQVDRHTKAARELAFKNRLGGLNG